VRVVAAAVVVVVVAAGGVGLDASCVVGGATGGAVFVELGYEKESVLSELVEFFS
jgi:hypothetical protein